MDGTALQEPALQEPALQEASLQEASLQEPARQDLAADDGRARAQRVPSAAGELVAHGGRRRCVRRSATRGVPARVVRRLRHGAHDAGMATAEYAIATLAAVGFAGLLVVILKGNEVRGLLGGIIKQALSL